MVGLIGLYPWDDGEPGDMVGLIGLYPWSDTQCTLHNGEPSVVTWNYENIRSLKVVIWSQTINTFCQF